MKKAPGSISAYASAHYPSPGFPYKASGDLLRGNRRVTFHSAGVTHFLHHAGFPTAPQLTDTTKPWDVIAPPQVPRGLPGNAKAAYCNRGQRSGDLSPSGGRPQRPQRSQSRGSSGWPVIPPPSMSPAAH